MHPDAIIGEVMVEGEGPIPHLDTHESSSSEEISGVESEVSEDEGDAEDLEDNFNSAGEEVRGREGGREGGREREEGREGGGGGGRERWEGLGEPSLSTT